MIKLIVLDIDGVLTDGTIIVNSQGQEQKKVNIKDIDAVFELKRRGFLLAAITGEDTEMVSYFRKRFPWNWFFSGDKHKLQTVKQIVQEAGISLNETAYVGDGKYDISVLPHVGLGFCPADAIEQAKLAADVVLSRNGGSGCLWEIVNFLSVYNQTASEEHFFWDRMNQHRLMFQRIGADRNLMAGLINLAQKLTASLHHSGQLFLCGNGGSAADAQHIAAEFVGRFYQERPAINAEALTVNTSTLTAIGNDYGFERVFTRQLEAKARPGDVLIGISTSGASLNVLEALRYAKSHGILAAAFVGMYVSAELSKSCDIILCAPSDVTPRIQEAHGFMGHLLAEYVENALYAPKEEQI